MNMIRITNKFKMAGLMALSAVTILTSCNKDLEQFAEPVITAPVGQALGEKLAASPNDSLYYKLIVRGGLLSTINNKSATYTMFVPTNSAVRSFIDVISGGATVGAPDAAYVGFINTNIPAATAAGIVSYNVIPQSLGAAFIPTAFPNFQYPTLINPAPSVSALLRLTTFPSKRGTAAWVNNVPIVTVDNAASNGLFHEVPAMVLPPSQFLWDRINADADLTILKAAIQRADSGFAPTSASSLIGGLQNIGANLTVLAPRNAAMKSFISALSGGLIPVAAPDANFIAFIGSNFVTTQAVKGIAVYHILGTRVFSVNLPATAANFPTLLNGAPGLGLHPGVSLQANFTGPSVTSATVKGLGNATASNILINPTPSSGTSDQSYLNGTIHKIDQVLRPQ